MKQKSIIDFDADEQYSFKPSDWFMPISDASKG